MLGFRVRINEAEYPDQKPWIPFSSRIEVAISETDGSAALDPDLAEIIDAVCFLVTIFEIGVVKNFEQAPANAPTASSSRTGNVVALLPFFCNLFVLK